MKKTVSFVLAITLILMGCCGCSKKPFENNGGGKTKIDVDLTRMSSTMVYSKVYEMLDNPDKYVGKTVRIKGTFAVYEGGENRDYYFVCVVYDAAACCQQGIEFRLKGDAKYPDDYPKAGSTVTVTGVFTTYMEENQRYVELTDSTI